MTGNGPQRPNLRGKEASKGVWSPNQTGLLEAAAPYGCPPPNIMGHCFVETLQGEFIGLVQTTSLEMP